MGKTLKMGVIGLGFIGGLHARIIAECPNAELVAVADVNEKLAKEFAEKYGCKAYSDYREMLKDPEITAVDCCLPEDFHCEAGVAVAEAKKDLLMEKPIAKTVAEAEKIKKACEDNGVRLMVEHVLKFDPRYVQLDDAVKAGQLGEISQVAVKRQNPRSVAERFRGRVSFFYYLGVHDIEWMLDYVGKDPVKVYAVANDVINHDVNEIDSAYVTVSFDGGAIGSVVLGWSLPSNDAVGIICTVEAIGSKGMGSIEVRNQGVEIITADQVLYPDALFWPEYNGEINGDLRAAIQHFVTATLNGTPYRVDTDRAIKAVAVIEAAFKSIKTGEPVLLK